MREPAGWRHTARTIAATALVTSAAWLIGGAIFFDRLRTTQTRVAPIVPPSTAFAPPVDAPAPVGPTVAAAVLIPDNAEDLAIPVAGVAARDLVDTFTASRAGGRLHDAIDIMAPRGTPVVAAAPGQVEKLFVSQRGGNTVYVRSTDRRAHYYYAHLDTYAPGLAEGQTVRRGQQIGTVGFSGDASPDGPHLHFEIQQTAPDAPWYKHEASLNPYPLLTRKR